QGQFDVGGKYETHKAQEDAEQDQDDRPFPAEPQVGELPRGHDPPPGRRGTRGSCASFDDMLFRAAHLASWVSRRKASCSRPPSASKVRIGTSARMRVSRSLLARWPFNAVVSEIGRASCRERVESEGG